MKIIYVDKPIQNEHTKDPQLIEGKVIYWTLKSECLKESETFQEFLKRKVGETATKEQNFDGMLIHDFQACATISGRAGLIIRYRFFKNN